MLAELEELAREKSSDRRRELLRNLTNLFFIDEESRSEINTKLYDDILCKIINDVENEAKSELSNRLAPSPYAPKGIVMKLALDDITIAEPILRLSPLLTDDDLIHVVNKQTNDHMVAISNRSYVSEKVTDVLIDKGNEVVHKSVAMNDGAHVSEQKMQFLVTFAQQDPKILEKLQFKKLNQEKKIKNLVGDLNDELVKRLQEKNIGVSDDAELLLDAMINSEVRDRVFKQKVERINIKLMLQHLKSGQIEADGLFLTLVNSDQFIDMGTLISEYHEMPEDVGLECLMNKKDEPLMILMKAMGCTERSMEAVLKMRAKRNGVNYNYGPALATFSSLTPDMAQRVIRFLKIRQIEEPKAEDATSAA